MERSLKLKSEQTKLLKKIGMVGPFIEGSLTSTKTRCSNPKCKCVIEGPIHDTVLLTWKENNVTRTLHIPQYLKEEVQKWVNEYRALKAAIKEASVLQREILIELRKDARKSNKY
jgi:hypothetical protein